MKKINYKTLIISIGLALAVGVAGTLLGGDMSFFDTIKKPFFAPPKLAFPIVWTILYILMGISSYMIYESDNPNKWEALKIYGTQLIVNSLWTLFFFRFKLYLFSFFWLILLLGLVIYMILKFDKIKKEAGYLQIPYIIWLLIAAALNLSIYFLN